MVHLSQEQRYEISTLKQEGRSNIYIAEKLGFNKSSIGRELKRNSDKKKGYLPELAQKKAEKRRENRKAYKLDNQMSMQINTLLKRQYSPEQIVGTMKKKGEKMVSHECIYQYIYTDKKQGGKLYENLRFQRKKRCKRLAIKDRRGIIPNKKMIAERPKEVQEKVRFGDWEGDTIVGKDHKGAILTLVERISKLTFMVRLEGRNSESVEKGIVKFFNETKLACHTITFDNGKEFSRHQEIENQIDTNVYFANPYHSWERGLNENTNGLIRQYIPKKTDFSTLSVEFIQSVQEQLNNRPRKTLNFDSPLEFLKNTGVAFQT